MGGLGRGHTDPDRVPGTPRSTVSRVTADLGAEETFAAPRVVAVLSSAYMNSPEARSLWRALAAADAAGIRRQIVPIRVSDARIAEPFGDYTPIDLARADATQAMARLLSVFDRPWHVPGAAWADGPRFPGTVPRLAEVPARNADFTGRAETLEQLRDRLSRGGTAVAQVLYGLGGVGKTQLAQEYAHPFSPTPTWSWVPSERAEEISLSFAELARRMQLRVGENVAEAAAAALAELRGDTTARWLIIFDNADNADLLKSWLPTGNGHVIITSRNKEWTNTADSLEVDVFSRRRASPTWCATCRTWTGGTPTRWPRPSATSRSRSRAGQRLARADGDARARLRGRAVDVLHRPSSG